MKDLVILVLMIVCLFGPMSIFVFVGKKALDDLGKRPSEGAKVMIPFLLKLMGATAVSVILLMIMLKAFGPDGQSLQDLRYDGDKWVLTEK